MKLIFKIAWRNIMRHKGKSFVIGSILFLGALLMTVGSGVISGMDRGMQANIINGFTGDIVLVSKEQESDNVFLEMMGRPIEPIYNYKQIDSLLKTIDFIDKYLPIGKNAAMVLNEEGGAPGYTYVLGVDFEQYYKMFPKSISMLEGRLVNPGEAGVLFPTGARKEMFNQANLWFTPENAPYDTTNMIPEAKEAQASLIYKDNVVFMGISADNTSTDIRVGVKGIFKYTALNSIWGNFITMDIDSYRRCLGYFTTDQSAILSESEKALLDAQNEDLDALFSSDIFTDEAKQKSPSQNAAESSSEEITDNQPSNSESGAYNLVLVLLKDHKKLKQKVALLDEKLKSAGLEIRAVTWKKSVGTLGSMASLIKISLLVFVSFLFFVAIIIIVNTLSMAALERTSEIGMMRAVGARKGFITSMFLGETALLSFSFGGIGIAVGFAVVQMLSLLKIKSDNDMVQLLFGGDTFHPFLSVADLITVMVLLAFVTIIAVIYPLLIARKISPLDAIARD